MDHLMEQVVRVAPQETTVLLTGATGTGKTWLASLIHELSPRRVEPFLVVQCGALAATLTESELFGHVRGAFTGADRERAGKFTDAGRGTVLLDEIDALAPAQQAKLLRAVLALLHRLDGLNTILTATAALLAGLLTWVASRLLRAGLHPLLALLLTLLAMLASAYHFHPRPHLLSILFLGWTFALLCDVEAGRLPLKRLIWLLPLFVLWTNIHGGMLGGFGTLAITALGWMIARWTWLDGPNLSSWQMLGLALLVVSCGLTAFFNPYGSALPRTWFALLGSPLLPRLIDEHAPLLEAGWAGSAVLLVGSVYLVARLGVLPRRPRVTWLVPLIWLALSFTRIRHGPLFALTAVLALAEIFPHIRWAAWLARKGSVMCRLRPVTAAEEGKRIGFAPAVLPCMAVSAVLFVQAVGLPLPGCGREWVRLDPRSCPMELLPELHKVESMEAAGRPIFNEMLFGGFLIYHTPGLRVFIDDRCELYEDDDLMAYALALRDDPSQINRWAKRYGFKLALTRAGSRFDTYLREDGGWTILGEPRTATLLRRDARAKEVPDQ